MHAIGHYECDWLWVADGQSAFAGSNIWTFWCAGCCADSGRGAGVCSRNAGDLEAEGDCQKGDDQSRRRIIFGEVPFWTWLSNFVGRFHLAIVVGSIVLMVGLGWGIQWLKTSVHLRTLFPAESRILRDYAWIEGHVAPLVPLKSSLDSRGTAPFPAPIALTSSGTFKMC